MADTVNKGLEKPAHNADPDAWDVPVNANSDKIDACLGDVTYINMTGLASYDLVAADVRATTIIFVGAVNNATVQVKMPAGAGGSFNVINTTSVVGASSLLRMAWSAGGNTYDIAQPLVSGSVVAGVSQVLYADGVNLVWGSAGAQSGYGCTNIVLDGTFGFTYNISELQARNTTFNITGTCPNSTVILTFPRYVQGLYSFNNNWAAAGGSSVLAIGWAAPGGPGQSLSTTGVLVALGVNANWHLVS